MNLVTVSSSRIARSAKSCLKGAFCAKKEGKRGNLVASNQRYKYRVLQTIQMKLILLCVWAERAICAVLKLL